MSSAFELLGGAFNIVQILGAMNRHVLGFRKIERALKVAEASAKRIENKFRRLDHLHALDRL